MGRTSRRKHLEPPALGEQLHELRERFADYFHATNSDDLASEELERLRSLWRDRVRHQPPYVRAIWLASPNEKDMRRPAVQALGAGKVNSLLRDLKKQYRSFWSAAPSQSWVDAWGLGAETTLPKTPKADRKLAARLKRRRVSLLGMPNRWTPPQCFEMENEIDAAGVEDAARRGANWPSGPSADAIERIEHSHGVEERWAGREHLPGTGTVEGEF